MKNAFFTLSLVLSFNVFANDLCESDKNLIDLEDLQDFSKRSSKKTNSSDDMNCNVIVSESEALGSKEIYKTLRERGYNLIYNGKASYKLTFTTDESLTEHKANSKIKLTLNQDYSNSPEVNEVDIDEVGKVSKVRSKLNAFSAKTGDYDRIAKERSVAKALKKFDQKLKDCPNLKMPR